MKIQVLNNKGNTLLIVLLITAVFSILFLSFMVTSANTTKQNEKVEETSQSVALAEMGAEYYTTAISNELNSDLIIKAAKDAQQLVIDSYKAKNEEAPLSEIKEEGIKAAYNEFTNKIGGIGKSKTINPVIGSPKFTIVPKPIDDFNKFKDSNYQLIIAFDSIGSIKTKDTTINATLEIDFDKMTANLTNSGKVDGDSTPKDDQLIADPDAGKTLPVCGENGIVFDSDTCKIDGDLNLSKHKSTDPTFKNSTIKINGSLTFDSKFDIGDSTLYITGNFFDPKGSNVPIIDSDIYIGGNATFGNLNNSENVIIEIMGDATFLHNLNGDIKNIKICVHGKIKELGQTKDTVKVYEKGEHPKEFESGGACYGNNKGDGGNSSPKKDWNAPIISDKKYEY